MLLLPVGVSGFRVWGFGVSGFRSFENLVLDPRAKGIGVRILWWGLGFRASGVAGLRVSGFGFLGFCGLRIYGA